MIVNGVTYPDRRTTAAAVVAEPVRSDIDGYDPITNTFKPVNESVSSRVTGLMSTQDPLQQQARAQAAKASNRRGLLNSSIGVQAGQVAGYQAALPIASQEAGQAAQTNQQGRSLQTSRIMGDAANATQMSIATQRAITELTMAREGIAADKELQDAQLGWQGGENQLDRDNRLVLQNGQLTWQSGENDEDRAAQLDIAGMNLTANERTQVGNLIVGAGQNRTVTNASINANTELNPTTRQQLLDQADADYVSDINLIGDLYGVDLDITWTSPSTFQSGIPAGANVSGVSF